MTGSSTSPTSTAGTHPTSSGCCSAEYSNGPAASAAKPAPAHRTHDPPNASTLVEELLTYRVTISDVGHDSYGPWLGARTTTTLVLAFG